MQVGFKLLFHDMIPPHYGNTPPMHNNGYLHYQGLFRSVMVSRSDWSSLSQRISRCRAPSPTCSQSVKVAYSVIFHVAWKHHPNSTTPTPCESQLCGTHTTATVHAVVLTKKSTMSTFWADHVVAPWMKQDQLYTATPFPPWWVCRIRTTDFALYYNYPAISYAPIIGESWMESTLYRFGA